MARIFTAGNELSNPPDEGWYWNNDGPYVSVNQRFGPRTSEQNSGEWYYYVPGGWSLTHILGTHGKPTSFPVAEPYSELYVRFHYYPFNFISGERSIFSFVGADGTTPFFTLTAYDQGGSGTSGNNYGMQFSEDLNGTPIITQANIAPNNVWALTEVHLKLGAAGSGAVELRINEVVVASVSGTFLGPSGETGVSGIQMHNTQISGSSQINGYDNWAVNDTTGSFNNSWPGDGFVYVRVPHQDGGTTQLATDIDSGGVDNADRLGAGFDYRAPRLNQDFSLGGNDAVLPVKDKGFVRPTAVPQKDTYTIKPLPFDAGQVNAVSIFSRAKSRDGLSGNVRHLLQPQAQAEIQGGAVSIPADEYAAQSTHFSINTNTTAPFTVDEVENLEIGIQFEA